MPARKQPLANGQYYHVFNRGVAKLPTFINPNDYKRFVETVLYYQLADAKPRYSFYNSRIQLDTKNKLVELIAYSLMPNHFHLLIKQNTDDGISNFVRKLCNSYTRYINIKHKRSGPLFQGRFKAIMVDSNEQLVHLSRYIHLNPLVGYVTKNLESYPWSSYLEYINGSKGFCEKDIILGQFKSKEEYRDFILDQESYGKELELIKHQLID